MEFGGSDDESTRFDRVTRLGRDMIDENEAAKALAAFDPVWETLTLREQVRVLQRLV